MTDVISTICLLIGSFFTLLAGIGVLVMPDILCRAHALSKALTMGISILLIAVLLHFGTYSASLKILLAITFQFITIPLSGHIFSLYAHRGTKYIQSNSDPSI